MNERIYNKITALVDKAVNEWENNYFKTTDVPIHLLFQKNGTFSFILD